MAPQSGEELTTVHTVHMHTAYYDLPLFFSLQSLPPPVMAGFKLHVKLVTYNDGMDTHTSGFSDANCNDSCDTKFKFCLLDYGCEETAKLVDSGIPTGAIFELGTLWPVNVTLNVTATRMDNTVLGEFRAEIVELLPQNSFTTPPTEYMSIGDVDASARKAIELQYRVVCNDNYSGDQCTRKSF